MPVFQTANLRVDQEADGQAVLWLDVAGRPFNVFSRQVLADLGAALEHVSADAAVRRLTIRSAKPSGFLAGADLHEFTSVSSAEEAMALSVAGQQLFDQLAGLPVPTVAVIDGLCLGGGLELALACDYRVVVDRPGTQLGFPEVELGLLPGWGGTQRLPRVAGLERALQMILAARRIDAREARRWGLADAAPAVAQDTPADLNRLAEELAQKGKRPKRGLPLRTWRQRVLESTPVGRWLLFQGAERILRRRVPEDMPAPWEALQAVRVGLARGITAGLAYERAASGRLATTTACRNLVSLFFQREKARQVGKEPGPDSGPPIRRVGVVGSGTMGAGIAQLAALKGYEVVIQEVDAAALGAGMLRIVSLFEKAVARRLLSHDEAQHRLKAIQGTTSWEGFADVDLVVEAVIEDLPVKEAVCHELERRVTPEAILATNTSSLSVARLQEGRNHAERVAGLHFFNPVHKMPLVEVVRAPASDERTIARLAHWAVALGKTPVVVKDSPGFVVNRVLMPYLNEAVLLVAEGVAAERIDREMRRFGMPMGPLELLDQVGLDVAAHVARSVRPALGDRFAPNPAFEQMCQKGWLGVKSGTGFYRHQGKKKRVHLPALALLRGEPTGPPPELASREARARMVGLMINEAAACLGEGLAENADTIDLALVFGTGWAPHRGGPLRYADDWGISSVVGELEDLARRLGPRFEPCPELRRRAESGEPFYKPAPAVVELGNA